MRPSGLAALLLITVGFIACKKTSTTTPQTDKPGTIDITSPAASTTYDNGLVLKTEGAMNDENGLTSAKLEIRNKATSAILFQQTTTTGNITLYHFLWNWTVSGMTAPITATVRVTAIDKLSNQVFQEVDIILTN
jgi:hypothetical protein